MRTEEKDINIEETEKNIDKSETEKTEEEAVEDVEELIRQATNGKNFDISCNTDTLGNYLYQIRKYRVLTKQEEKILFRKIQSGDEYAWMTLYCHNLRLVVSIAKKYFALSHIMDQMDIVMEGNLGLIKAISRFDVEKDTKFSTYATWWIKQNITRELANKGNVIRIPVHLQEDYRVASKAIAKYQKKYSKKPSIKQIAEDAGISESRIENALKCNEFLSGFVSLDSMIKGFEDGDEEMTYFSCLPDPKSEQEFERVETQYIRDTLESVLKKYPERNREIFRRRFGFTETGERETLEQIGADYGITRERVRQIELKILKDLRGPANKAKLRESATIR